MVLNDSFTLWLRLPEIMCLHHWMGGMIWERVESFVSPAEAQERVNKLEVSEA